MVEESERMMGMLRLSSQFPVSCMTALNVMLDSKPDRRNKSAWIGKRNEQEDYPTGRMRIMTKMPEFMSL